MTALGFILYRQSIMSFNGMLLCLNALAFTIAALSISYLIGILLKSKSAQSAIANILSLGLCFLSGVFVPQELLSSKTIAMAALTPPIGM